MLTPALLGRSGVVEVSLGGTVRNDNEEVMVWLESSLEYARDRNQARLAKLLESVRAEVEWEAVRATWRDRSTERCPEALGSPYATRNPGAVRPERAP